MIITRTTQTVNAGHGTTRSVFNFNRGRYRSAIKARLKLRGRRVANGPLFNNDSLAYVAPDYGPSLCMVGVLYRGAERKFFVPIAWRSDARGNMRRVILRSVFDHLPRILRDVAIANGVCVTGGYVTFARCIAAWAGHKLHKGLHCHHVDMDPTNDRLENIHVLTVAEHAAAHDNPQDYIYDPDWYEYTSENHDYLRLMVAATVTEEDVAVPVKPLSLFDIQGVPDLPLEAYGRAKYGIPDYFPLEYDDCYSTGWVPE